MTRLFGDFFGVPLFLHTHNEIAFSLDAFILFLNRCGHSYNEYDTSFFSSAVFFSSIFQITLFALWAKYFFFFSFLFPYRVSLFSVFSSESDFFVPSLTHSIAFGLMFVLALRLFPWVCASLVSRINLLWSFLAATFQNTIFELNWVPTVNQQLALFHYPFFFQR